uniref:Joining chain of multimeric IgA and IgM n=1 Tax=Bos taurus TaxID=9913 RepID=A0AAA9T056_BOVIN
TRTSGWSFGPFRVGTVGNEVRFRNLFGPVLTLASLGVARVTARLTAALLYHVVDLNRTVILQARSTASGTDVPLNSRENISDPTSPMRTKFVYHLSDLCKKCDTTEVELEDQVVTASQSNICDSDAETCYTYDRNKCYTNRVKLSYRGQTKMVETALTPDSCYPD